MRLLPRGKVGTLADMTSEDPRLSRDTLTAALIEDCRAERDETLRGPDTDEGRELGRVVGANLANYRREHGVSLDRVSKLSGISTEILGDLEEGNAIPSLRAVWHLATALGVPFGLLLGQAPSADDPELDFRVQRRDDGQVIASANNAFRSRVLFHEGDPRTPEVYELTLAPGCVEPAEGHSPNTYEHISVISGSLLVRVGKREVTLSTGDAIFFRADQPHCYENPSDEPTMAHLVMKFSAPKV